MASCMIQLELFTDEIVKSRKPVKTSGYVFPYDWANDTRGDGRRMIDKYSPWQMKLWAWLKKNKHLSEHPNMKHFFSTGSTRYGGSSSWCPQKLIHNVCHATYKQTWWNFRHRERGHVRWERLDITLKIYLRDQYSFNFGIHHFKPSDPSFIFTEWYANETVPYKLMK